MIWWGSADDDDISQALSSPSAAADAKSCSPPPYLGATHVAAQMRAQSLFPPCHHHFSLRAECRNFLPPLYYYFDNLLSFFDVLRWFLRWHRWSLTPASAHALLKILELRSRDRALGIIIRLDALYFRLIWFLYLFDERLRGFDDWLLWAAAPCPLDWSDYFRPIFRSYQCRIQEASARLHTCASRQLNDCLDALYAGKARQLAGPLACRLYHSR